MSLRFTTLSRLFPAGQSTLLNSTSSSKPRDFPRWATKLISWCRVLSRHIGHLLRYPKFEKITGVKEKIIVIEEMPFDKELLQSLLFAVMRMLKWKLLTTRVA